MANEGEKLRDRHRLFGLLLTDFFTGSFLVLSELFKTLEDLHTVKG